MANASSRKSTALLTAVNKTPSQPVVVDRTSVAMTFKAEYTVDNIVDAVGVQTERILKSTSAGIRAELAKSETKRDNLKKQFQEQEKTLREAQVQPKPVGEVVKALDICKANSKDALEITVKRLDRHTDFDKKTVTIQWAVLMKPTAFKTNEYGQFSQLKDFASLTLPHPDVKFTKEMNDTQKELNTVLEEIETLKQELLQVSSTISQLPTLKREILATVIEHQVEGKINTTDDMMQLMRDEANDLLLTVPRIKALASSKKDSPLITAE